MNEKKKNEMDVQDNSCPVCGLKKPDGSLPGQCMPCLLKAGLGENSAGIDTVAAAKEVGSLAPGEIFGHYRLVRLLGKGGMGAVYEAEDLENGRHVAVKIMKEALDSTDLRKRFLREGRLAASVNHPNSVYVFAAEEISGMPTIAMELLPGGTLQDKVKAGGPLPVAEAVDCALQIIDGLEAAQSQGVIHRDIKPSNCFVDSDGTIKIGDYGLSVSSTARWESTLTVRGSFVGTPAFSSPEQIRGEEMTVRSDIFALGITLYYLLTGRTPFESENMMQLISLMLERVPDSPCKWRENIPDDLGAVILHCLEKLPERRFAVYADLRKALAPYNSAAPSPATIAKRFMAGLIDWGILGALYSGFSLLFFVDLSQGKFVTFMDLFPAHSPLLLAYLTVIYILNLSYYAIPEGLRGASFGKWILGLRVTGPDKSPPGIAKAYLRAAIFVLLPNITSLILSTIFRESLLQGSSFVPMILIGYMPLIIMALLFCTMRRRNGFSAVHDMLTKTHVTGVMLHQARPVLTSDEAAPTISEAGSKVGPYHVLESLEKTEMCEWLLAYDTKLLRKIWLRTVPAGTPPVASHCHSIGRVGRLRWITGRRSAEENWDAFEGLSGKPFTSLLGQQQEWRDLRYWLLDIADEISMAEKDGTLPETLSLDRVWITGDDRAKLLDFRAPGAPASNMPPTHDAKAFLEQVACYALAGPDGKKYDSLKNLCSPIPIHARKFLESMDLLPDAGKIAERLRPLLQNVATVTRRRRVVMVMGGLAFPLLFSICCIVMMRMSEKLMGSQPEFKQIIELSQLLDMRNMAIFNKLKGLPKLPDEQLSVYIASHYRQTISDKAVWHSSMANIIIKGANRQFAEKSLADHPNPSEKEIEDSTAALKPYLGAIGGLENKEIASPSSTFLLGFPVIFLLFTALCALAAALFFRGGLVMLACGVDVVRKDGMRASRIRIFWRSLVAWSPMLLAIALLIHSTDLNDSVTKEMFVFYICASLFCIVPAIWSLMLCGRSLQDRIAGTTLVPR